MQDECILNSEFSTAAFRALLVSGPLRKMIYHPSIPEALAARPALACGSGIMIRTNEPE